MWSMERMWTAQENKRLMHKPDAFMQHPACFYDLLNSEARYWLGVMPVSFLKTLVK